VVRSTVHILLPWSELLMLMIARFSSFTVKLQGVHKINFFR